MNEAEIRKYASLMRELDLTGIEIDEKQGVIRLERERDGAERGSFLTGAASAQGSSSVETQSGVKAAESQPYMADDSIEQNQSAAAGINGAGAAAGGLLESVLSPTVGVFYAAPAENADPYVKAGDTVRKGDVLCIIEAMKLMNEVLAEKDGVIEAVCAENGQIVEYGTELFRIREMSA